MYNLTTILGVIVLIAPYLLLFHALMKETMRAERLEQAIQKIETTVSDTIRAERIARSYHKIAAEKARIVEEQSEQPFLKGWVKP